jgi:hypothetical protein
MAWDAQVLAAFAGGGFVAPGSLTATTETMITSGSFNDAESVRSEAILQRFNQVFLSHDAAALPDLVAADCVIENT